MLSQHHNIKGSWYFVHLEKAVDISTPIIKNLTQEAKDYANSPEQHKAQGHKTSVQQLDDKPTTTNNNKNTFEEEVLV